MLALIKADSWGWGSSRTLGLLALSVVALAAFVTTELRVKVPMLDFSFFPARARLFGVNIVAFIISFAMFAQFFFFLTLYMQNEMHLSPLATGVRFLALDALPGRDSGPGRGTAHLRTSSRAAAAGMVIGLVLVAIAIYIDSHITIHSGYGLLLPGVCGDGFAAWGWTMSPMSTAAMNAVDRSKAGAASGVLSMSRMVGSTFGVAVMGALVTTIGHSKLNQSLPNVPAHVRSTIASALGSGAAPHGRTTPQIIAAVREAFVSSLGTGLLVGAIATMIGAFVAWALIENRPGHGQVASSPAGEEAAEAVAVEVS